MGVFTRSRSSSSSVASTTSRAQTTQYSQSRDSHSSRIPTVSISVRRQQSYAADPRDMDEPSPAFIRTNSYYLTGASHSDYKHLQASDVRRQFQQAPAQYYSSGGYPKEYGNRPPRPLSSRPPYREYPIMSSPRNGSTPRNYTSSVRAGPVRAFYNNNNRREFDVDYHDPARAPVAPRYGRSYPSTPYNLAEYVPGPIYTEVRPIRRICVSHS